MKKPRSLSIRIDDELLQKLRYVSDYDGRSANSEVLYYIRKGFAEFEKEHGVIDIETKM